MEEQHFVDGILQDADSVFKPNGNYAAAINIILEGLKEHAQNSRLVDSKAYYESFRPILLLDFVDFYTIGGVLEPRPNRNFEDSSGVLRRGTEYGALPSRPCDVTQAYYLGGRYTDFYGTIVFDNIPSKSANGIDYVRIFGDDQLLFEESGNKATFDYGDLHVDITGVDILLLELGYDYRLGTMVSGMPGPIIVNPFVVDIYTGFPYTEKK